MKKIVIAVLLMFGFSTTTFAQVKGDVELGFNVGYNNSTIATSDDNADSGNGINLGFAAEYFFSDRWGIKGKLIYDQKGWDNDFITDINSGFTYKTNYNLNYLTIPVMANWHFAKKRNWYLNFGPYVGFLMNAEDTRFGTDVKYVFKSTDFGLAFGIGVKIPVSDKLKLTLEYDAQSGLSNVFNNSDFTVTNSRSSFNVGVNFIMK
jgi:opacity protein-like surface antigen